MQRILVFGGSGQLGQSLQSISHGREIVFLDRESGNILDLHLLNAIFEKHNPTHVVNCAAYTAVDLAEEEELLAGELNITGASNLANLCKKYKSVLFHISTDFVFEGNEVKLLNEKDKTNPVNVYGETKRAGEIVVEEILKEHYIIRTSWLYSEFGNNFVKTMLKLGASKSELNIVADQVGTPTYAVDLAQVIFNMMDAGVSEYGIYHFSNEGVISWYDFATSIFNFSGSSIKLNPIPASSYPTKAKRPAFSVMDKSKIKSIFKLTIPYWRDSLQKCLQQIR